MEHSKTIITVIIIYLILTNSVTIIILAINLVITHFPRFLLYS